ncbi:hypothetical protein PF003_g5298 [Phytophthora fragariae]|nr:hypothetical protein PF003_g5298 [Phytophthora fragariae]
MNGYGSQHEPLHQWTSIGVPAGISSEFRVSLLAFWSARNDTANFL